MNNAPFFRKITIIGVGLIGGSIGMAIKKNRMAREVVGMARRHAPLVLALKNQAIDKITHDINKAVNNADLIILATPVETIMNLLPAIGKHAKRGCIITDVGSTKTTIVREAERNFPQSVFFVGSHPVAGSEKKGNLYASAALFEDSLCIVTPTDKTNRGAKEKIKSFWAKIGANVRFLSPEEHDKTLAYISHAPHILAYGLVGSVPTQYLEYASTGFKDTTRIASSDPQLWNDICMANSKNILRALDDCVKNISTLRKAITSGKEQDLIDQFKESKKRRDGIS